jgi:flagellar protein FliO/FliZ
MTGLGLQSFAAVLIVLGLVFALAWLVRRGSLGTLGRKGQVIQVETAVPLGERRSLVIVAVEGRRLLLGLAPGQVSVVTELARVAPGGNAPGTFEQHLDAQSSHS